MSLISSEVKSKSAVGNEETNLKQGYREEKVVLYTGKKTGNELQYALNNPLTYIL